MKKLLPYILIFIALAGVFSATVKVQAADYYLLSPLPCDVNDVNKPPGCTAGRLRTVDPTTGLGTYLNLMIKIFIGICAVLSVVMIVVGGVEYMTSELVHTKEAGKERIQHALLGLIIALGAYALLYTINPDLLISDVCVAPQVRGTDGKCANPPAAAIPPANNPLNIGPGPNSGSNTNNAAPPLNP